MNTLLGIALLAGIVVGLSTIIKNLEKPQKAKPRTQPETAMQEEAAPPLEKDEEVSSPPISEEMVIPEKIFISHHSRNTVWIETLARNLDKLGYHVLLDFRETQPLFQLKMDNTLLDCHKAILVATPEAIESGWVREEYEWMVNRQQTDPDFTFMPVLNEMLSDFPFVSDDNAINFSTENYVEAFHRLVSHFGETTLNENELERPPKSIATAAAPTHNTQELIENLFIQFEQSSPPPLMLLTQMDRHQTPMVEVILTQARKRYQENRCLHIALPYSTDTQDSFPILAQQCGFSETVNNGIEFEQALRTRLDYMNPLFLLISRFENGAPSTQQQLAAICRSLNETYANQILMILCGGEKLVKFKYQHDRDSLLNIAQDYRWPELERADVYAMRDNCCQTLPLDDENADKLLALSGGHPILLQKCLQLYQNDPAPTWQDYPAILSREPLVVQLFASFMQNPTEMEQMREWLTKREDIAPSIYLFSSSHQRNELLQHLYWKNLLVERRVHGHKRLCWRCEALRLAGKSSGSHEA